MSGFEVDERDTENAAVKTENLVGFGEDPKR